MRQRNEDVGYVDPEAQFFIVADGMGGHAGGDVAAATAVDAVREILDAARLEVAEFVANPTSTGRRAISDLLTFAVHAADDAVRDRARREPDKHGMGTTLEVLLIAGDEAFLAHAGDSRAYLVRGGVASLITRDHTMATVMIAAGTLTPADAKTSPMSTVLVNAVGAGDDVMVDIVHRELRPGDRILLCSDGLYDHFDDDELGIRVASGSPDVALRGLVTQACARGGHDNITGVVVDRLARQEGDTTIKCLIPPPPAIGNPLAPISEDTLSHFVERSLHEKHEESGPISR